MTYLRLVPVASRSAAGSGAPGECQRLVTQTFEGCGRPGQVVADHDDPPGPLELAHRVGLTASAERGGGKGRRGRRVQRPDEDRHGQLSPRVRGRGLMARKMDGIGLSAQSAVGQEVCDDRGGSLFGGRPVDGQESMQRHHRDGSAAASGRPAWSGRSA